MSFSPNHKNLMFDFITDTWNPIAGGVELHIDCQTNEETIHACPYKCVFCWARMLINRHKWAKYQGHYRLHEPEMKRKFHDESFVFVQDMSDIGAPQIPRGVIIDVLEHIRFYEDATFLLLTKNPDFYRHWGHLLPENTVLGATIETDLEISREISLAPEPWRRLVAMVWAADNLPQKRFICVEPIMKCSPYFERDIMKARPYMVAVGYDNYEYQLPEPRATRVEALIKGLEAQGVDVVVKSLREAWDQ